MTMRPLPERVTASQARVLEDAVAQVAEAVATGEPADQWLRKWFHAHHECGSRDRRLVSETIFAWFRWRGWTESSGDLRRKIAVAMLLDSVECPSAITFLADAVGIPCTLRIPFGGRNLTDKSVHAARLMGVEKCNVTDLVPSWFWDAVWHIPSMDAPRFRTTILAAFQSRPPTWLRIDPRDAGRVLASLTTYDVHQHPVCKSAIRIPPGLSMGRFPKLVSMVTVQDLSSQAAGLLCDPAPGSRWWDACAGSGGKTLHLAALLRGRGEVVATDVRPSILRELDRRLQTTALRNVSIRNWSGTKADRPTGLFDGALVDAPCSGTGTWHRNPDARWRTPCTIIEDKVTTQSSLIDSVADSVRPGGILVYAVCSMTEAEGPGIISRFLCNRTDWTIESCVNPLNQTIQNDGTIKIAPGDHDSNGMFIARLRRRFS